jgi:hypothetical protein
MNSEIFGYLLCLGFFVVGVFIVVQTMVRAVSRRRRARSFHWVVGHFRGRPGAPAKGSSRTIVAFEHAGRRAALELGARRMGLFSRPLIFRIAWPDEGVSCEVRPRFVSRRLDGLRGMTTVSSGDAEFDKLYRVRGRPPEKIELLLSAAVRICINQIRFLYDSANIHLRIADGELTITKRGLSRHPKTIIRFGELALELFDQAMLLETAGLTFLPDSMKTSDQAAGSNAAVCRVCGEEFAGKVVVCRTCRTPHHRDCWQYFGGCATYGCGGRKCDRKATAAAGKV